MVRIVKNQLSLTKRNSFWIKEYLYLMKIDHNYKTGVSKGEDNSNREKPEL